MNCDLEIFIREILGKWGFTMSDWVYLQNAYKMEREIQRRLDIRDGFDPEERYKNLNQEIENEALRKH